MAERGDEFYVGYLARAPSGIAKRARFFVVTSLLVAALVAVALIAGQRPFALSVYEFGVVREFVGVIREEPYPLLVVKRPGGEGPGPAHSRYYLTVFGKRGAGDAVAGLDGREVRVEGELIYRDGQTMIQIVPETLAPVASGGAPIVGTAPGQSLGEATLVGEIVDSKCFLGVMKPGHLKPHRACAVRCISGGVPPVLVTRDAEGRASYYLLVSREGKAVNREVLDLVAEPVEITGEVVRIGDLLVLRSDPTTYRRL